MIAICAPETENEPARAAVVEAVSGASFIELDHSGLPANDDAATVRVLEILEAHGILRRH
jgi:hypothetical protein